MLIGSAGLQIPSVWSHVFKTGWGAELLNFFFSSGSQGLEVAEDDMQTELGGLGKILCKQHCSSKSSTKHCTSVCPYKTNGIWTPLMGLRNKLFSNKCLYNRSGKEGPGHQRKWDSAGPICQRKPGGGVGGGAEEKVTVTLNAVRDHGHNLEQWGDELSFLVRAALSVSLKLLHTGICSY